jgi:predicted hydrolase (HD superfamily)
LTVGRILSEQRHCGRSREKRLCRIERLPGHLGATTRPTTNETLWGITALLHDFDYERWPNQEHHPSEGHPTSGVSILRERGYPEEMIHAILGHADYTGVMRETTLDHVLFACDEMAGFLTACALIRPGKTIFEVEPGSVKKRMKDKAFARGVSRDDLLKGAEELGVPIEEHMATCIEAMCGIAESLGLERKS